MDKHKTTSIVFLSLAFATSLFFTGSGSVLFAPMMLCLLLSVASLTIGNPKRGFVLPKSYVLFWLTLFYTWVWASTSWSTIPYISIYFAYLLSIVPILFLGITSSRTILENKNLYLKYGLYSFAIIISGLALWAIIQFFVFYDEYGARIRHPFSNPNNLAALFNIALVASAGLFMKAKTKKHAALLTVFFLLNYIALSVTFSRAAILFLGITLFVMLLWSRTNLKQQATKLLPLLIILIATPLLIHSYNDALYSDITSHFAGNAATRLTAIEHTGSIERRLSIWTASLDMVKDSPLSGFGLSTFSFYYPSYRPLTDKFSSGLFVHMDPIQFAVEMGIPATILFYAFLCAVLLRTISALKQCRDDAEKRLAILWPFCAMLVVLMHTHISFHLYIPALLLPLSFALSYWFVQTQSVLKTNTYKFENLNKGGLIVGACAATLALAIWPTRGTVGQHHLNTVFTEIIQPGIDIQAGESALNNARTWLPKSHWSYYEYKARLEIENLKELLPNLNRDQAEQEYQNILKTFDEGKKRNPQFYELDYRTANLHFLMWQAFGNEADFENTMKSLEQALHKNPLYYPARSKLADLYVHQGNLVAAADVLNGGMKWIGQVSRDELQFMIKTANMRKRVNDIDGFNKLDRRIRWIKSSRDFR